MKCIKHREWHASGSPVRKALILVAPQSLSLLMATENARFTTASGPFLLCKEKNGHTTESLIAACSHFSFITEGGIISSLSLIWQTAI